MIETSNCYIFIPTIGEFCVFNKSSTKRIERGFVPGYPLTREQPKYNDGFRVELEDVFDKIGLYGPSIFHQV